MTVQRATSPEPGPSHPIVPATTSGSHADEQHCRSRVLSQPIFVRHDVGTYTRLDVLRMSDNDKLWLLQNAWVFVQVSTEGGVREKAVISKCVVASVSLAVFLRIL